MIHYTMGTHFLYAQLPSRMQRKVAQDCLGIEICVDIGSLLLL